MDNEFDILIEEEITSLLISAEMPANNMGFTFLKYAIFLAYKDPSLVHNLISELYPRIAQKYKKTYRQVERNMRYIIDSTYNISEFSHAKDLGAFPTRPKVGNFISRCENALRKKVNALKIKYRSAVKNAEQNNKIDEQSNKIDELQKEVAFYKRMMKEQA